MTLLAAVALAVLVGACGGSSAKSSTTSRRSGPRTTVALRLDDLGPLQGCTGYGHSYVSGAGVPRSQNFLSLACRNLVGSVTDDGVSGSTLQQSLLPTLQKIPGNAARQLSVVMWGINDLGAFGSHLDAFEAGLRLLVSRLRTRAADVHSFSDPAMHYGGRWRVALGQEVTRGDGRFTWTSPTGFPGGTIAFLIMLRRGLGGRYVFTVDGRAAGTFDTLSAPAPPPSLPASTPGAWRVHVPAGPGHVVTATIIGVHGFANVLGWELESNHPPLVVLVEQPRPVSYAPYVLTRSHVVPTDAGVLALNHAIDAVAAEFGNYVVTVNPDPEIGKRPADFLHDGLHPNLRGHSEIAALIEQAVTHNPHVVP
jgi:lysophospholipase L1-like esterase